MVQTSVSVNSFLQIRPELCKLSITEGKALGGFKMTFGEALIQIMSEKGIKPAELARLSGVSKQTINELIKGRSKEPTFTKAKALANGLGVPLQVLADMTDSEN